MLDVLALEVIDDIVEVEERLDFEELVDAATVVLVETCEELDEGTLDIKDEEALFVVLDVNNIELEVEVDGLEVEVARLDVELDVPVDDEGLEDAVVVEDEELVEELLVKEEEELDEELDEELEAVRLNPAPTPAPEYVPDAVLKAWLDCVTVGLL
jgi:hypothetical protein